MLLYLLLFKILCVPLIFGRSTNTLLTKSDHDYTGNSSTTQSLEIKKTTGTVVSEGGATIQNTPSFSPPKEKITSLLSLDQDLVNPKSVIPSKVKPRKGAPDFNATLHSDENSKLNIKHGERFVDLSNSIAITTEIKQKKVADKLNGDLNQHEKTTTPSVSKIISNEIRNGTLNETNFISRKTNKTDAPKKPLILSYEVVANAESVKTDQINISATKSSSITLVTDQMPPPSEQNRPTTNIHRDKLGSHPGMIMPVVMTMLVVPMFAVLGYLALQRGKEAWKNRHYKRMDFLLDGMYND